MRVAVENYSKKKYLNLTKLKIKCCGLIIKFKSFKKEKFHKKIQR